MTDISYKLPKKLWYVKNAVGKFKDISESDKGRVDLSYLTHADDQSKEAFSKRQTTGKRWAAGREKINDNWESVSGEEFFTDNVPIFGFEFKEEMGTRWSTESKYFRVKDPRGFVVEIGVGNMIKLIHNTTIEDRIVQDKCVWVWQRTKHILVPVSSALFSEVQESQRIRNKTKIKAKDMSFGDVVASINSSDKVYLGSLNNIYIEYDYIIKEIDHGRYWSRERREKEISSGSDKLSIKRKYIKGETSSYRDYLTIDVADNITGYKTDKKRKISKEEIRTSIFAKHDYLFESKIRSKIAKKNNIPTYGRNHSIKIEIKSIDYEFDFS